MRKICLFVLFLATISLSAFGMDQSEIDEIVAVMTLGNLGSTIEGSERIPREATRVSADTFLLRGVGRGGDERLVVYTTNNILGVVAVSVTDTGPNSQETFNIYRRTLNNSPHVRLENEVATTNSVRGTLVYSTGFRVRFSMQYFPNNQQFVMTVMRN